MPKIEIIAIGDEVLQGAVVNTNAARISQSLNEVGLEVNSHVVVGDIQEEIKEVLLFSIDHFDISIVTGGLGPTCDDITKSVLVEVYDTQLRTHVETLEKLKNRYPDMDQKAMESQSMLPKDAIVLENDCGTAPGLMLATEENILFSLPGVPIEVEHLINSKVIPLMQEKLDVTSSIVYKNLHFAKMPETQISQEINFIRGRYPEIKIGIYPHSGVLSIHLRLGSAPSSFEIKCLNDAVAFLKNAHQDNFFSESTYDIPLLITDICSANMITIAVVQDLVDIPLGLKISGSNGAEVVTSHMSLSSSALAKRFRINKVTSLEDTAMLVAKQSRTMFSSMIGISIVHSTEIDKSKKIMYCFYLDTGKHFLESIPKRHQPDSKRKMSIISNYILFDLLKFLRKHFKEISKSKAQA